MLNLKRLRNIREDHDLSQSAISRILNVSRSTYSLWELGINIIPLGYLYKFAKYFNCSIDYIVNNSNKKINISQENLAKLLNVTQPCINRYEKGSIEISTYNLYKISKYLNVSIDGLTNEKETIKV